MLVLSRKLGETIVIDSNITVTVLEVSGSRVRLGFKGPSSVPIHREEVHNRIEQSMPGLQHADTIVAQLPSECHD